MRCASISCFFERSHFISLHFPLLFFVHFFLSNVRMIWKVVWLYSLPLCNSFYFLFDKTNIAVTKMMAGVTYAVILLQVQVLLQYSPKSPSGQPKKWWKKTSVQRKRSETAFGLKQWWAVCAIAPTTQYFMTHAARHCFMPNAVSPHLPSFVIQQTNKTEAIFPAFSNCTYREFHNDRPCSRGSSGICRCWDRRTGRSRNCRQSRSSCPIGRARTASHIVGPSIRRDICSRPPQRRISRCYNSSCMVCCSFCPKIPRRTPWHTRHPETKNQTNHFLHEISAIFPPNSSHFSTR